MGTPLRESLQLSPAMRAIPLPAALAVISHFPSGRFWLQRLAGRRVFVSLMIPQRGA